MRSRWIIKPPASEAQHQELSGYSPILRQLLINRGYTTNQDALAYLDGSVNDGRSPFGMRDMDKVVERIHRAVIDGELIAIYGDYDVDGVTATVLLVQYLRSLGAHVIPYIPNRFEEGYGLNNDALDGLLVRGTRLVVTVDCGVRSIAEANHAKLIGLDLIITDHHDPGDELPDAYAILNPKRLGDDYPCKVLAGVGIAYKVAQALSDTSGNHGQGVEIPELLDLVALGTVADLAPLVGENRALVKRGMIEMHNGRRPGLFSLANVSGIQFDAVNTTQIGFNLGPRLNAAGRLESALAAYELLIADNLEDAAPLALRLDNQNRERQVLTHHVINDAEKQAFLNEPDPSLLFVISPDYNPGIVGLAAARLTEKYYKPAVVGQSDSETTRCSCRSIPEFNISKALDQCADLLVRHGGHAAAAGFTVTNANLGDLKKRLFSIAEHELAGRDLRPTLFADMELALSDIHSESIDDIARLQPTGQGNPDALFISRAVRIREARTVGADGKHLKLRLGDGVISLDGIAFRLGEYKGNLKERADFLYALEFNEYKGRKSIQLNIKDIQIHSDPK